MVAVLLDDAMATRRLMRTRAAKPRWGEPYPINVR
jgi:hypothetical protein